MERRNRKSVNDNLNKFDFLAKENDFIEVTEWVNGEGVDVVINDKSHQFSYGQIDAINFLTNFIKYCGNEKF